MEPNEAGTEWEYEYETGETEDFYFTLDVSSNQQATAAKASQANRKSSKSTQKVTQSNQIEEGDKLQILGLDSIDPLIMHDGHLYSCQWSTDLGTQFYIAKPGVAEQTLRSGHVLDVLGLSRVRLIGSPATLRERRNDSEEHAQGATAENAIELDDHADEVTIERSRSQSQGLNDTEAGAGAGATPTPRTPEITDPTLQARASFLERLQSIKQRKGETDRVPLYGVKNYQVPANKQEIRQRAMEADMEKSVSLPQPNGGVKTRGSYKRKSANLESSSAETKRRKPGPKMSANIKASLDFDAASYATPPPGSGLLPLRPAGEVFPVRDNVAIGAQTQRPRPSNGFNGEIESTGPQDEPTNAILDQT